MKKFMTDIKTLAALLMAGAAFTACSSSDDNIIEQPQNPTEPKVYTLVIKASKGGDATTRALQLDGSTLNAYWSGTETIEVGQAGEKIGTATAAASANGETTITATLTQKPTTASDIEFYLCSGNLDYTGQVGLLTDDVNKKGISEKYDYTWANLYTGNFEVNGYNVNLTNDNFVLDFVNDDGYGYKSNVGQAIVKFTLVDKGNSDAPINATSLTIHDSKGYLIQSDNKIGWDVPTFGDVTISPAGTTNVIYAALAGVSGSNLTLTATDGTDTYTYSKSNVTFNRGQYYEITVKMTKQVLHVVNDDTSEEVTKDGSGEYFLPDDGHYTVSGIGSGNIRGEGVTLTIEDGTVINGYLSIESHYSGKKIANIILNGDATVNGNISSTYTASDYTLISSASGNHTLTVNGKAGGSCWRLAEGVTLRYSNYQDHADDFYYGYVKNADGSADLERTIADGYAVYVGSGTVGGGTVGGGGSAVVTVWFNSYIPNIEGSYVVFNNDDTHVTLTDTGTTGKDSRETEYKCYTAPLTAGAETYTVYDSSNNAMTSSVNVSDGDIYITWPGGDYWDYKNW